MDIEYLHEFTVLARRLNYRETATELCMSQSALSRHIAALEDMYGVALFQRDRHEVHLTEAGAFVLDYAESIWTQFEQSIQSTRTAFSGDNILRCSGVLFLSSILLAMSEVERRMRARNPSCSLRIERGKSELPSMQLESVVEGDVDCAALFDLLESSLAFGGVEVRRICTVAVQAVVRKGSRLACKETIDASDLQGCCFIHFMGSSYSPYWRVLRDALDRRGVAYSVKSIVANSDYSIVSALGEIGDAVYLVPYRAAPSVVADDPNLVVRLVDPDDFHLSLDVAYAKGAKNQLIELFIDALSGVLSEFPHKG